MEYHMTINKKQPSIYDANFMLPEDLTPMILAELRKVTPSIKTDYLLSEVTSKFVSRDTSPSSVRRARAISKWLATERNNEATNDRLMTVDEDYNILPRVTYKSFMETIRHIIRDIIGDVVPDEALLGAYSGGASTSRKRTESHPALKYVGKADVTAQAHDWISDVMSESPIWSEFCDLGSARIMEGNVLFTVPKTTEIDRCACKEPDLNVYLQKGAGAVIRNGLRRIGIDLNDQSRNRALAKRGSDLGDLATIDLSSASDSISHEFVYQSIPTLWYTYLNSIRSPRTIIDGEVHVNEMFSSMGNGFTFELESLLFYAVARAVCYHRGIPGIVSVYGDDIIIPVAGAADLTFVLSFLGFETNEKKSFSEGPFRESCGGHYYNGRDITPFYIKKPVTHLVDVIHVANALREWASFEGCTILDLEVEDLWLKLAGMVPKCFWGGVDTGSKERLVTYERPYNPKALQPMGKRISNGDGGYLLWLDSNGTRTHDVSIATSSRIVNNTRYRGKAVRWSRRGPDATFLRESVTPD